MSPPLEAEGLPKSEEGGLSVMSHKSSSEFQSNPHHMRSGVILLENWSLKTSKIRQHMGFHNFLDASPGGQISPNENKLISRPIEKSCGDTP